MLDPIFIDILRNTPSLQRRLQRKIKRLAFLRDFNQFLSKKEKQQLLDKALTAKQETFTTTLLTDLANDDAKAISTIIASLSSILKQATATTTPTPTSLYTADEIATAKQVPLLKILPVHPNVRETQKTATIICPFHKESTPSFTIYKDSNSFFCFGCNAHGDAIDAYQRLYNTSFKDTISALLRM